MPVLIVAGVHYGLHGISHILDAGEAEPLSAGIVAAATFPGLAAICGVLVHLAAHRAGSSDESTARSRSLLGK